MRSNVHWLVLGLCTCASWAHGEPFQFDHCLKPGEQDSLAAIESKFVGQQHADVKWVESGDVLTVEIRGCNPYEKIHVTLTAGSYAASGDDLGVIAILSKGIVVTASHNEGGEPPIYTVYAETVGFKEVFAIEASDLAGTRVNRDGGYEFLFDDVVKATCANGRPLRRQRLYDRVEVIRLVDACMAAPGR